MANDILGGAEWGLRMGEQGRAVGQQMRLAKLAPQIMSGDLGAFEQAAAINPQAAQQIQTAADASAKRIRGAAKYMHSAVQSNNPQQIAGAWQTVRPYLERTLGKPMPAAYDPASNQALEQLLAKTAYLDQADAASMPSGYREFELMAKAAGLKPGTPEYEQAANIGLGRAPRAVTGAMKFDTFKGVDGRPRPQRNNPSTGGVEIYYDELGQWVPLGGGAPQAPQQQGVTLESMPYVMDPDMAQAPPQVTNAIHASEQAAGNAPAPQAPRSVAPPSVPGLGVGRSAEEEAAAVEAAKQRVNLNFLPQTEAIKTDAAIGQAEGIERAKAGVAAETDLATKRRDALTTLALLKEAEKLLPQSTGSTAGRAADNTAAFFGQSTEGAKNIAALQTIAGQLTSRMPRMQGPQSDRDVELYKQMAGDLANPALPVATRLAALRTIRALNEKYANDTGQRQPESARPAPRTAPQSNDIDALLEKYR